MTYSPTRRTDSPHAAPATARSLPVRGLTAAQRFTAELDAEAERVDVDMWAQAERLATAYTDRITRESAIDRAHLKRAQR